MNLNDIIPSRLEYAPDQLFGLRGSTLKICKISRKNLNKYKSSSDVKPYLNRNCTYILINSLDREVYVGQANSFLRRAPGHTDKKWTDSFVIIDSENNFSTDGIKYLEHRIYSLIKDTGNYSLINKELPWYSISPGDVIKSEYEWLEKVVKNIILFVIINNTEYRSLFDARYIDNTQDPRRTYKSKVLGFVKEWARDDIVKYGNTERWTGWGFTSKVLGEVNPELLEELQTVAIYMCFNKDERNLFELNEHSIKKLRESCDLSFKRTSHRLTDLQNFKRQHLLLMQKMGLVEKANYTRWNKARLTELCCEKFVNLDRSELDIFLYLAIERYCWPDEIVGINVRDFTRNVINKLGRVPTKDEFKFILSHGGVAEYTYSTEEDITELITMYDLLSEEDKKMVEIEAYGYIREKDIKNSTSSLPNWRKNIEYNYNYIVKNIFKYTIDDIRCITKYCTSDVMKLEFSYN